MPESAQEKRWKAESDARTLMDAEGILSDTSRVRAAKPHIKKLVVERQKEAVAAKKAQAKITGRKSSKARTSAGTNRKRKR